MQEIIKAYLLIYQNTCSTSESSKKVLYGIFIVYAITCIKLRSDAALSKLKQGSLHVFDSRNGLFAFHGPPLPILSTISRNVFTARGLSLSHDQGPRINNHSVSRGPNIFICKS